MLQCALQHQSASSLHDTCVKKGKLDVSKETFDRTFAQKKYMYVCVYIIVYIYICIMYIYLYTIFIRFISHMGLSEKGTAFVLYIQIYFLTSVGDGTPFSDTPKQLTVIHVSALIIEPPM